MKVRNHLDAESQTINVPYKVSQVVSSNIAAEQFNGQLSAVCDDRRFRKKSITTKGSLFSKIRGKLLATVTLLHHGHHFLEDILSLSFECIVPPLCILNRDLLLARS